MSAQIVKLPTTITHDEWIAAWRDAVNKQPEQSREQGMTSDEIGKALGLSISKTKQLLTSVHSAGRLVADRAPRLAIDGTVRRVQVYRIT